MQSQGIHGLYNRRAYAGYRTAQDRTIKTIDNVVNSLVALFDKGITNPINQNVSDEANLSIRTYQRVKKYVNKAQVFMSWIKSNTPGVSTEIDLRPYVILIAKRVFQGIQKRVEMLEDGLILKSELKKSELMQMQLSQTL